MRIVHFLAFVAITTSVVISQAANAQQIMDGSDRGIGDAEMKALRRLLSISVRDPYGSQLEDLKLVTPGRICGRLNTRNGLGALTGFRPFGANLETGELALIPDRQPAENAPTVELEEAIQRLKAFIALCELPKP